MSTRTAAPARPAQVLAPPGPSAARRFLPEVQALRAVAVLLVIGYHLRPDLLPGGFIGVDVFFVISGYLITGHMVREVEQTGRLSLTHFWANRARRILPAALLVIGLIVLTATFVVPITEWRNLGRQALASIFYLQNWVLAADSVDYSASDNAATPFQHFWSLAVEEQFYLLWPFVVVFAAMIARRLITGRRTATATADHSDGSPLFRRLFRRSLLIFFGTLVLASFVWSVIKVADHDPAAYFVTTTRLWELGLGGLLAVILRHTDRFRLPRSMLALAGLAAIAVGTVTLSGADPFPGAAALVPTLGAAAVISAGRTAGPGSLTVLVDLPPVQWIGNVSYSLYLWHFPIAVYFTTLAGRRPSALESLGLIVIMVAGSAASYYGVEQPIRTARWARQRDGRALLAAAMAMVLIAGTASTFWIRPLQQQRAWDDATVAARTAAQQRHLFGAGSPRAGSYRPFVGSDRVMAPNPITAKQTDEFREAGAGAHCEPKRHDTMARRCDYGDLHSSTVIAVVGDSHARMYLPAVLKAAEQHGWHVIDFLHNSCPYSYTARIYPTAQECLASNHFTAERLKKIKPDVVVTAFYGESRFVDDGRKWAGTAGLAAAWRELTAVGSRVVAIKDAPLPREDVVACVAEHYQRPRPCAVPRGRAIRNRAIVQAAARGLPDVSVLDLTDRFCNATICPAVIGDVLVYIDGNHISRTYAESLTPDIEPALAAARRPTQH